MKPELSVLPMDVWADVFVYPWISRQQLALIVDRFKERGFAEKLQKFLHDPKCGKHSLHHLIISSKLSDKTTENLTKYQLRKWKNPQYQASLAVAPCASSLWTASKDCEFPDSEMPENITSFKRLTIGYLDDEVLAFLHKIKPLFTDVSLKIIIFSSTKLAMDVRIFFDHLLPMIANIHHIHGIWCGNECIGLFEQHFPGTLAMAKKFCLLSDASQAFIPTYLNLLNAPQDFDVHGPRFFNATAPPETIIAIVNAVCQQFLAATTSSAAFVIFLKVKSTEQNFRVEEFNLENAKTNEQLVVRNATSYEEKWFFTIEINNVKILRNPMGADAIMRDWIKEYEADDDDDEGKQICIKWPTIGRITKEADDDEKHEDESNGNQYEDEWDDEEEDDDVAGPSTSAKMVKK